MTRPRLMFLNPIKYNCSLYKQYLRTSSFQMEMNAKAFLVRTMELVGKKYEDINATVRLASMGLTVKLVSF